MPSPTGKEHWNKHSIEKMLGNEKYTGAVTLLDSATREYEYLMKECHLPIITESDFRAVQEEKKKRSNIVKGDEVLYKKLGLLAAQSGKKGPAIRHKRMASPKPYVKITYMCLLKPYRLSPKSERNFAARRWGQSDSASRRPKKKRSTLGSSTKCSPPIRRRFSQSQPRRSAAYLI